MLNLYVANMEKIEVYSPIGEMRKVSGLTLQTSPIWKEAYHLDEIERPIDMFKYTIKFNGLIPVQIVNMETGRFGSQN